MVLKINALLLETSKDQKIHQPHSQNILKNLRDSIETVIF